MKKIIYFSFLLLLISCGDIEYTTHVDKEDGYQIDYPENWDTRNIDLRMSFVAREDSTDENDLVFEGVSISVYNNEGRGLDEIVDENIKIAKQFYGGAKISEENVITASGLEGIKIRLIYSAEGTELINYATFFRSDKNLYTITQGVEAIKDQGYKACFEHIINSFQLL